MLIDHREPTERLPRFIDCLQYSPLFSLASIDISMFQLDTELGTSKLVGITVDRATTQYPLFPLPTPSTRPVVLLDPSSDHEYGSGLSSCGSPMTARWHGSSSSKINHSGCATNRAMIQRIDLLPAYRGVVVTSPPNGGQKKLD